jgi:glycosyltransferase involved in cell wall biosynthesis
MVIVGTEAGRREVEHFYGVPRSRIRKLPHPTPTFALPTAGNALPPSHERAMPEPYVVYPAQFWAHKNHVGLLRAIAILRDVHDARLHLALVGSDKGSETHVRRAARELNLEDQVHFLGFVARESLVSLYRGALALAYVSYFGPENLPPLEAFALGCPVVAGDVSGAREQLGSAALLVPPSDPRAIADALLSIHRDQSLRLDLISRGVERAAAYTSDSYALDMFRILDELEPVIRTWR